MTKETTLRAVNMKNLLKRPAVFFVLFVFFVIAHNLVYAVFGFEEPVFFLLSLASLFLFVLSFILKLFKK